MAEPAERFAEVARACGWVVQVRRGTEPRMTYTTETSEAEEGSRSKRVAGAAVDVPVVAVKARRGQQTVWATWRDGKASGAVTADPLRSVSVTEATKILKESHTWACRWLPMGASVEVCQAHGEKRVTA